MIEAAAARLKRDVSEVDALNVYPLPDGDTGRNMYQTIVAALVRAREAGPSVREVSDALARGALMGARGNSGVILSQILRGFRDAFAEVLEQHGVAATVRISKGQDIKAGCGQLKVAEGKLGGGSAPADPRVVD